MTRAAVIVVLTLGYAATAFAQGAAAPHRFSVSAGLAWLGGYPVGSNSAALRRNEPGTLTPSSFTLFRADTSLERAFGANARFAIALTRAFSVEIGGSYSYPGVAAAITGDAESDTIVLSDQHLSQFSLDGSLVWVVPFTALGSAARPYVLGGAGYLRQIDDDRVAVETGTVGHVGGGLRYWLRGSDQTRRALGVRGEARLQVRSGGFELEDRVRLAPAFHLLFTLGF